MVIISMKQRNFVYVILGLLVFLIMLWMIFQPREQETQLAPEINSICILDHIVDGDTIWVKCLAGFKEGQRFKVRLAEIDAPEMNLKEGRESKAFLESLLENASYVFLDVDEEHTYDRYGRVIAVVYIPLNGTSTFLNVNYYLVSNKMAEWVDYHNSWHPEDLKPRENLHVPEELFVQLSP